MKLIFYTRVYSFTKTGRTKSQSIERHPITVTCISSAYTVGYNNSVRQSDNNNHLKTICSTEKKFTSQAFHVHDNQR
jgi:hypothetical protein